MLQEHCQTLIGQSYQAYMHLWGSDPFKNKKFQIFSRLFLNKNLGIHSLVLINFDVSLFS